MKIGENRLNIMLKPKSYIPGMNTPCLFEGQLEKEEGAVAAVIGCHNSSKTLLTISSSQVPGGILDLSLIGGITYNLELNNQTFSHGQRRKRQTEVSSNDYRELPKSPFRSSSSPFTGTLPSRAALKTNLKYDNSLLEHFQNSHAKTKEFLNQVVALARVRLSHASIIMKVDIKIGEVDHLNEYIKANDYDFDNLEFKERPRSLTSYFCKDLECTFEDCTRGLTYRGNACVRYGSAMSINELWSQHDEEFYTARTFAHELGHNIGMHHDHDPPHYGKGCNGKGLMSYFGQRDRWSSCSNTDLENWWRREGGYRCVN